MAIELIAGPEGERRPEVLASPDLLDRLPAGSFFWLDITGPTDDELNAVAARFGLHELVVEDIRRGGQRPKFEEYPHYGFLVFYPTRWEPKEPAPESLECALVIGQDALLTFHRAPLWLRDDIIEGWRSNLDRISDRRAALLHAWLDTVVDEYFDVVDRLAEEVGLIEETILDSPGRPRLGRLFELRKVVFSLRRLFGAGRDALGLLIHRHRDALGPEAGYYLGDVYDHLIRVVENLEMQHDLVISLTEAYLSQVSNRLNQTMQTLTVLSTILMSAALIAGIYGMNYRLIPADGESTFGFVFALGLMLLTGLGLFIVFRRRGWV